MLRHGHKIGLHEGRLKIGIWLFRRHGGKVVFWGRFVSILRTYAAFLAGTNQMAWPRFLVFNAAGAVVWATASVSRTTSSAARCSKLSTTIDITLGVAGVALLVAFLVWSKRKEDELLERAEREMQGTVAEELGEEEPADVSWEHVPLHEEGRAW